MLIINGGIDDEMNGTRERGENSPFIETYPNHQYQNMEKKVECTLMVNKNTGSFTKIPTVRVFSCTIPRF